MSYKPRRSVLYMPGANSRALEKAKSLPADALILDLEDSVAPEQKDEARRLVSAAVSASGFGRREVVVRTNGLDTHWFAEDAAMAARCRPDALLVPKLSSADDVKRAASAAQGIALWAMIETPLAILNLAEIGRAAASHNITCLVIGTNDLVKDSRMSAADGRFALIPALSQAVLAARAFGLSCIDGVYNDIQNQSGFLAECEQGQKLGMDGKTLIHPQQIETCNRVFSPSASEISWAREVDGVFALPENAGKGVVTLQGRMVERLHLEMARRILAVAEAIS